MPKCVNCSKANNIQHIKKNRYRCTKCNIEFGFRKKIKDMNISGEELRRLALLDKEIYHDDT